MPKTPLIYSEPLNILAQEGTTARLIAISYFRGETGKYAGPARDMIDRGIDQFLGGLSPAQRRHFDEILQNVLTTQAIKKQTNQG